MAKESDIKQELLRQMDRNSVEATDVSLHSAREIIEKHKAQLRRLKWSAAVSWLITILYFVGMHILKDFMLERNIEQYLTKDEFWFLRYSDTGLIVLIIISVLLSYLVYSKSRTLTILQVCARLANIEEYLKKMSQDK
jgi:heme/copper-type cytochrome/quinol oxidase subunit 1